MSSAYSVSHKDNFVDRSDKSLLAGWEMHGEKPGRIEDVSGNSIVGIMEGNPILESCLFGQCLRVGDTNEALTTTGFNVTADTPTTHEFLVKPNDNVPAGRYLADYESGRLFFNWETSAGEIILYDGTNRVVTSTPSPNYWYHVVFVLDGLGSFDCYLNAEKVGDNITYTPRTLGGISTLLRRYVLSGTTGFGGACKFAAVYSEAKDSKWTQTQYNKCKLALFKTEFAEPTDIISSYFVGETPWEVYFGNAQVVEGRLEDERVSKLMRGTTTMRCAVDNMFMLQSPKEAAYGEWELWFEISDQALYWSFISNIQGHVIDTGFNAYSLTFGTDGAVNFRRSDNGVLVGVGYILPGFTVGELTHMRVQRFPNGDFKIYSNGVLIIEANDTTYTDSYFQNLQIAGQGMVYTGSEFGNYSYVKRLLP